MSKPKAQIKSQAKSQIPIAAAKGRPMLSWVGKRALRHVTPFPAQLVETFDPTKETAKKKRDEIWTDWPEEYPKSGLLFYGDNKEVLAHLLANGFRGKVNLVYIDPPFDSGADYVRKVTLRGISGAAKIDGENYELGEQVQYTDIWANDNYLQFMYERLMLLKELLDKSGSIFLHCDSHRSHLLRSLLDEVFGPENFRNEVVREKQRGGKHHANRAVGSIHDTLFHYALGDDFIWNEVRREVPERVLLERYPFEDEDGRYALADCTNFKVSRPNLTYEFLGFHRTWKWTKQEMDRKFAEGEVVQSAPGKIPRRKVRPNPEGDKLQSLWYDVADTSTETDYPTEKSASLLERIIELTTNQGDLVLDSFIGSGTTAAVSQKLGRRWLGCDINKGAIQTTSKRLQTIINEQAKEQRKPKQRKLDGDEMDVTPEPAQLSFAVYRVNDYDLQIQHNEAVNLACQHISVERSRSDRFFDGTRDQGKRLVKIIPFDHPLSPLDLEEIKRELEVRPSEERDVIVVCLGKQTSSDAWLEDWNRLRKRGDVPNKIEIIELRTDPKYGQFFIHQPARVKVSVKRSRGKIKVVINDFISPSIIERLKQQAGVVSPQIDDWRAMVDSVMIDASYDGKVFNVALSDVPEKKKDLVKGEYDLEAPKVETTVAVKITDMLGEDVLVTRKV